MPIPLTRIDGVPDGTQVKPGMAFFADTGPGGMTCGSCLHRNPMHGGCAIYQKQTGQLGPRVALRWKACKFYEAKVQGGVNGQANFNRDTVSRPRTNKARAADAD